MTTSTEDWKADAPLAPGTKLLLEASAGTGKTHQTEGLVVRLVAEGHARIDQLLVITFTRAATAELRGRVRDRLVRIRRVLASSLDGPEEHSDDPVEEVLLQGSQDERQARLDRVRSALADYDQATISTIHSFCQEMLQVFAFSAGQDPRGQEQADAGTMAMRVVDDAMAAVFARSTRRQLDLLRACGWTREPLLKIAKEATQAHIGQILPDPEGAGQQPPAELVGQLLAWVDAWDRARAEAAAELMTWLDGAEGQAAKVALPGGAKPEALKKLRGISVDDRTLPAVTAWLDCGGSPAQQPAAEWGALCGLDERWNGWAKNANKTGGFDATALAPLARELAKLDQRWRESQPPVLAAMAQHVRWTVASEREQRGLQTYSSMLTDLADRLEAEDGADHQPLRQAMRRRFVAALIDEFQDTDECQWAIIRRVFLESDRHHLYLVGDPKQAIYRFRGANVGVYLGAVEELAKCTGRRARLPRNFRSDEPLVAAVNALWGDGSPFDTDGLDYEPVDHKHPLRLDGAGPPFELRWFTGPTGGRGDGETFNKADGRALAAQLAARRIHSALGDAGQTLVGPDGQRQPLRPGDFAVLCRSHAEAEQVRAELSHLGIFAVTRANQSVFGSPAAGWLLSWLEALATPEFEAAVRRLALTPLVGWTASDLATALTAGDDSVESAQARTRWSHLRRTIHRSADTWGSRGFAGLFPIFLDTNGAHARLVCSPYGERGATDLLDLVRRCDSEQRRARSGPAGLAEWLRARIAETATGEDTAEDDVGEVESDADAVTIATIHASKGLQFGIVLVPFCWHLFSYTDGFKPIRYSQRQGASVARFFDLHPPGHPERDAAVTAALTEGRQEDMRLLYVALTRARHQVITWGGAYEDVAGSALGRLLDMPEGDQGTTMGTDTAWAGLSLPHGERDRLFSCHTEPRPDPVNPWAPPGDRVAVPLQAWDREHPPGAGWQIASYSSLSQGRGVELDLPGREDDETQPAGTGPSVELPLTLQRPADPLLERVGGHDLFGGTGTGLWLHAIMEELDFRSEPLAAKDGRPLERLVADAGMRHGVTDPDQRSLACGLVSSWLDTPLDGPGLIGMPPGFTLRQLEQADRVDELEFHLRLGGGHRPRQEGSLQRLDRDAARAALLHAQTDAFRGRAWVDALLKPVTDQGGVELPRPVLPTIAGFLRGLIDLTFRVETDDVPRYFICDYKSNQLSGSQAMQEAAADWGPSPGGLDAAVPRLRRWHYSSPVMAWGMAHSAYHLQSLLYTVALHRLLEQRLTDYDYDRHIGGHLYLYLRGMEGAGGLRDDAGAPLGVWTDRWPRATVQQLSDTLEGDA